MESMAEMGGHDDDDLKDKRSHMQLPPMVKKEAKRLLERGAGQVPRDEEIAMLVDPTGQPLVDGKYALYTETLLDAFY